MHHRSSIAFVALAVAAFLAVTGCGSPTSSPSSPIAPEPRVVREVKIVSGPRSSVRVGDSIELQASAWFVDGSAIDVTNAATWRSYTPAATISRSGIVRFVQAGDARVSAQYQDIEDGWLVSVQPASLNRASGGGRR